jgi:hypothetical protein
MLLPYRHVGERLVLCLFLRWRRCDIILAHRGLWPLLSLYIGRRRFAGRRACHKLLDWTLNGCVTPIASGLRHCAVGRVRRARIRPIVDKGGIRGHLVASELVSVARPISTLATLRIYGSTGPAAQGALGFKTGHHPHR